MMTEHERMNYWWRRAKAAEDELQQLKRERENQADLSQVTRVTVVSFADSVQGRVYDGHDLYTDGAQLSVQDEGRTLKILPVTN